mmetsp:Transcript_67335/g.146765  ORF Transcript_67335/g.146765 Transcript_67335/m.146765 type:complete len:106 (+) Transcript_67335:141-458(+)
MPSCSPSSARFLRRASGCVVLPCPGESAPEQGAAPAQEVKVYAHHIHRGTNGEGEANLAMPPSQGLHLFQMTELCGPRRHHVKSGQHASLPGLAAARQRSSPQRC